MMKKILLLLPGIFLLLFPSFSLAQSQLKIGHVSISEIMASLPERDSAQVILEKETRELETTYEELTVNYNKLYDEYQKGLPTFSEIARRTREDELIDKQKRLNEFQQNATLTLQRRNTELVQPIYEKVVKAVEKVGSENGFTYILDLSNGSVVFKSKDSQDLNPLVLRILKPL